MTDCFVQTLTLRLTLMGSVCDILNTEVVTWYRTFCFFFRPINQCVLISVSHPVVSLVLHTLRTKKVTEKTNTKTVMSSPESMKAVQSMPQDEKKNISNLYAAEISAHVSLMHAINFMQPLQTRRTVAEV